MTSLSRPSLNSAKLHGCAFTNRHRVLRTLLQGAAIHNILSAILENKEDFHIDYVACIGHFLSKVSYFPHSFNFSSTMLDKDEEDLLFLAFTMTHRYCMY